MLPPVRPAVLLVDDDLTLLSVLSRRVSRADAQPVSNFIGAIVQAEQLGVPIAKVLQIQSNQLRIERRQRAEEAAAKAPVKMLFPMVGCIFPTIFIVILGPAVVTVMGGGSGL